MRRDVVNIFVVIGILTVGLLMHVLLPDKEVSDTERRKLAAFPALNTEAVFSEELSGDIEKYVADQFPYREQLRTLKAAMKFFVLRQLDNNGIYIEADRVYKLEYPLKEDEVLYGADKINAVCESYIPVDAKVYYSIIPDKNYFTAETEGYPSLDYDRLVTLMQENVTDRASYIDIFECLTAEDYYKTDTHWKQEALEDVVMKLANGMNVVSGIYLSEKYHAETLYPFRGVYYGQSALPFGAESLTYLTNDTIEALKVWNVEVPEGHKVYTTEKFGGMDGYDTYLNGAAALMRIENTEAATDKKLVIFRDSFGSSLAPLLIETYSEITLVDLRYMNSRLLPEYVDFEGRDVLFIYSTLLLNSAKLLK